MKKFVIAVIDVVAEKVLNLMVEENELTLQRNIEFVSKSIDGSAIRPQDVLIKVVGLLDSKTGVIESPNEVITINLADYCRKEKNEEVTSEI